jgi:hypothetical protein
MSDDKDDKDDKNALKHGAFSVVPFLPGEDPKVFKALRSALIEEYKPSGWSEKHLIDSIAKAFWQERRLTLYQHVQFLRAQKSCALGPTPDPLAKSLAAFAAAAGDPVDPPYDVPIAPAVEKTDDEALLELGDLVTLDHLDKELDVENKLHSKTDRLFKRFFQTRAMKQMVGLSGPPAASVSGATPTLELTATEPGKAEGRVSSFASSG